MGLNEIVKAWQKSQNSLREMLNRGVGSDVFAPLLEKARRAGQANVLEKVNYVNIKKDMQMVD